MSKLVPREDRFEINHEFSSLDAFVKEYVSNISKSGVFVRSKDPLPIGTRVNLRFSVVMEEIEVIEGIGEVVRVQQRPRGMGVVFVELTKHSAALIQKLIVRQVVGRATSAPDAPRLPKIRSKTLPPPPPKPMERKK